MKLLNELKDVMIYRIETEGKRINRNYLIAHAPELYQDVKESGSKLSDLITEVSVKYTELIDEAYETYESNRIVEILVNLSIQRGAPASEEAFLSAIRQSKIDWLTYFDGFQAVVNEALATSEEYVYICEDQVEKKDHIARVYAQLSHELHAYPTLAELKEAGVTRAIVRERFTNIKELREYAEERFPRIFKKVFTLEKIFNEEHHDKMMGVIAKHNRFIVSSIGSGPRFTEAVKSTMNYCKRNKALLILIPTKQNLDRIDPVLVQMHLEGEIFITIKDFLLFKNLYISAMEIDEKQVNPLAGMGRYLKKGRDSFIFASPKQMRLPSPIKKKGMPRLLSSTGAITLADYKSPKYRMGRRIMMAANDHLLGAIIVETNPKTKRFHKRQIQYNPVTGSFNDLGIRYNPDGTVELNAPAAFIFGDLHSRIKDVYKYIQFLKFAQKLHTKKLGLHDVFDSRSANPHDNGRPTYIQALEVLGLNSLSEELRVLAEDLDTACEYGFEEVVIIDSNHDDMLQRAFDTGLIDKDPRNAFLGNFLRPVAVLNHLRGKFKNKKDLMKALSDLMGVPANKLLETFPYINQEKKTLQFAVELFGLKNIKKVKWLDIDSSWIEGDKGPDGIGFELGDHGHKGANGSRGSLSQGARHFIKRVTGHSHTDGQINMNLAVGHLSSIEMADYAKGGLSSWVFSGVAIYEEGQAQHVTNVNGEMEYEKDRLTFEKLKKSKKLSKGKEYILPEENSELTEEDLE